MVYSRDQWIQLPVRDLYDSQIMLASINAARDMYEKGQQQVKDFQKDYGDFYSPIQKDMDWYNKNVINGSKDVINSLYDKGIDPLRSAEGRAAISRFVNNIPTGDINKLKMGSKIAQEYLRNRAMLEAQNKYNDDFEKYVNGGKSIEDWDTLKDGVWTRQSPSEFTTLKAATENWFNNRTPHALTKDDVASFGMPYDKNYDYTGYTYKDLTNVASKNTPGWIGSPIANYYRHIAKQQLLNEGVKDPTNAQVETRLQQNVADANKEWIVNPIKQVNEYAKMDKQFAQQASMQARGFQHDKEMEAIRNRNAKENMYLSWRYSNSTPDSKGRPVINGGQDTTKQMPLSLTQMLIEDSNQNKRDFIAGNNQRYVNSVNSIRNHWLGKAYNILGKADKNNNGVIDASESKDWKDGYAKLNPTQKKIYDSYISHYKWWDSASKQGLNGAISNGLLDETGQPTGRFTNALQYTATGKYAGVKDVVNNRDIINSKYYGSVAEPRNKEAAKTLLDVLSNGTTSKYYFPAKDASGNVDLTKKGTYGNAHPVVNMSDRGVWLGNVRANAVSTGLNMTKGSISVKFQDYLKKNGVKGWVVSNSGLGVAMVPNNGKYSSMDITAKVSVPKSVVENFCKKHGYTLGNAVRKLGLRTMDVNGNTDRNGEFVEIPISKQVDNNRGQGFGQIDQAYDKYMYGQKEAAGRELQQQYQSSTK